MDVCEGERGRERDGWWSQSSERLVAVNGSGVIFGWWPPLRKAWINLHCVTESHWQSSSLCHLLFILLLLPVSLTFCPCVQTLLPKFCETLHHRRLAGGPPGGGAEPRCMSLLVKGNMWPDSLQGAAAARSPGGQSELYNLKAYTDTIIDPFLSPTPSLLAIVSRCWMEPELPLAALPGDLNYKIHSTWFW